MATDILITTRPSIIGNEPSRFSPKLQQLLVLLPLRPGGQVPGRILVIIGVQRTHKGDVQGLESRANVVSLVEETRHVGAVIGSQDRGTACICGLVRPRGDGVGECLEEKVGHEGEFIVTQNSGEALELWIGSDGGTDTAGAVGVAGVGGDKSCDLLGCGALEEDLLEVGD